MYQVYKLHVVRIYYIYYNIHVFHFALVSSFFVLRSHSFSFKKYLLHVPVRWLLRQFSWKLEETIYIYLHNNIHKSYTVCNNMV